LYRHRGSLPPVKYPLREARCPPSGRASPLNIKNKRAEGRYNTLMSVLAEILRKKRERLAEAKARRPLAELKAAVRDMPPALDFALAIKKAPGAPIRLIAELKRASPSRGLLRKDFDPRGIARIYRPWAQAISVITEEDFFQGRPEYIGLLREVAPETPILRKDFVFDEYQLYEARALGADAVLLLQALLSKAQAEEYLQLAQAELQMAVLLEVHTLKELDVALSIGAPVVGINNRDLHTLKVDLHTTLALMKDIPADRVVVSESGISTRADVERLQEAGLDAILVGTALMEAPDIEAKIKELLGC